MPIYEFSCLKCGLKFDYLVRGGTQEIACPGCNQKELRRLVSAFAFNSKDASGNVTASSSGCGGCSTHNCSTCSG